MENSSKVISNFLWRVLEKFGNQILVFVFSIVLARLLDPVVYSEVALVSIFIVIFNVFVDSGLGTALVQKKEADELDFSSVFYANVFICIIFYIFLFFLSPTIANFYHSPHLVNIIRILGLTLIVSGITNIQNAYVSRHLMYKKFFYASSISTILSSTVGIWMAFHGYEVWALVFQNLLNSIISALILWIIVGWRPKLIFSFSRLGILFNYGCKLLVSSLIDTIWRNLRPLIIGKEFTPNDLAYYNKGEHFPDITTSSLSTALNSVLFPTMSKVQDSIDKVKELTRKSIKIGSYILWPILIGLAACADNFVKVLLTDKWMPIVPYMRIFCITYAFYPIHTSNLNAIKALGRSEIFLKLEVIKKVVGLVIILISIRYGVMTLALSTLLSNLISQIINSWPNKKLIKYKYIDQLKDIAPSVLLSLLMGVAVYIINFLGLNCYIALFIQVILGMVIYIGLSYLLKIDDFIFCVKSISKLIKK